MAINKDSIGEPIYTVIKIIADIYITVDQACIIQTLFLRKPIR